MPLIIPQFELSQTINQLIIKMRLPYVKVSKAEFSILKNSVQFFLQPYHLNLTFQEQLKESETPSKCTYDPNDWILTAFIDKAVAGEEFKDLHMITKLFEKKKKKQTQKIKRKTPLIEVIGENDTKVEQLTQQFEGLTLKNTYGFNNQYQGVFNDLDEELWEIAILNPEDTTVEERLKIRDLQINNEFDIEHYLYDLFENLEIDEVLENKSKFSSNITNQFTYSNEEINILQNLPKKEYIIINENEILNQLCDITFAFLYEYKIMLGDFSSESGLTINQLSSILSCFAIDSNISQVLVSSYRRCLCFPLYRSFEICELIQQQTSEYFLSGRVALIKIFIELKRLFSKSEPRYILNEIFIDDFLIYLQMIDEATVKNIGDQIKSIKILKENLQLDLVQKEQEALKELN